MGDASDHAGALAQIVISPIVCHAVVRGVDQLVANLSLLLRDQLVKLEEDLEGALMLRNGGLVLDCREEKTILGQVAEDITLRVLWRVDNQPLLVGVEEDFDHDFALEDTVVYD